MNNKANETLQNTKDKAENVYNQAKNQAEGMYEQVKDSASELYKEGKKKASETQDYFESCSKDVISSVREKPLTSLLIAGGIGFILSAVFKK